MGQPLISESSQLPITNHQLPITNHQLPITNHQLPITNHQLPITTIQNSAQQNIKMLSDLSLLHLLQLASPALPVGAYSYSDGLEMLVEAGVIHDSSSLWHWLEQELNYGAIRLEAAVMVRGYQSVVNGDLEALGYWNAWITAAKETAELRSQSWQMGNSLLRLLRDLPLPSTMHSPLSVADLAASAGTPCNYAIAFGIAAAHLQIDLTASVLGYLQSWATNLIGAGVKLIPLGQTSGQQLLLELTTNLYTASQNILVLQDEQLMSCGWGLALASMAHETQYTRLFQS